MININLSNSIGSNNSPQSESIGTDSSSVWSDFMSEFELQFEDNGTTSNKTDIIDDEFILYNVIYTIYEQFNMKGNIENINQLETAKNIMQDEFTTEELENIKNALDSYLNLENNSESKQELNDLLLESKEIKNIVDYIDEYNNTSTKDGSNKESNLLVDKIINELKSFGKSNDDIDSTYKKLDGIGVLNMSKIDTISNSKGKNSDIDCLEKIASSNDNSYSNSIFGFNKFNTVYNTSVNTDIEKVITEVRQEFISDDIVKAVKYIKSNGMEELNVKFNPKDLGEISINVLKDNDGSNLLITVDSDNVLDLVNNNIEDIKNHLKDTNINVKDVVIAVKQDEENMFSDNLNQHFNKEQSYKQNKNKKDSNETIEEIAINDYKNDENLNILI